MPSLRFSIDLEYKIRIREANLLFIVKVFLKYQRLTILNKTKTVSSNIQILIKILPRTKHQLHLEQCKKRRQGRKLRDISLIPCLNHVQFIFTYQTSFDMGSLIDCS